MNSEKTVKEKIDSHTRLYLLISYAQIIATITMILGFFIILVLLLVQQGLLG